MIIVGGAALGALVQLHCAACGETQARARGPAGTKYVCRKCGEPIELEQEHTPRGESEKSPR